MGRIKCCGGNHICKSFVVKPKDGFEITKLLFLQSCPICNATILELHRWDTQYNPVKVFRAKNGEALTLLEKQEIWQDLDKPLEDTSRKYVHGEFTKTKTRVVNHRGTVLEEWDTPETKVYRIEDV